MTLFWAASALLAAVALLLVMRPLLWRGAAARVSRRALNVAVYRDQLRELEADLRAGTLAQADYERARRELEARLLEDVENQVEETEPRRGGRATMILAGVSIPVLALAVYLVVGNPGAIDPQAAHGVTMRQVEGIVERLATRLKDHPDDVEGWKLLGAPTTRSGVSRRRPRPMPRQPHARRAMRSSSPTWRTLSAWRRGSASRAIPKS